MLPPLLLRIVNIAALTTVGLGLLLMAVRGYSAVSFYEPLQLTTSGTEFDHIYGVWKYINGQVLYQDHTKIPFVGTYYNWLFYVFYGEVAGSALEVFSLTDDWLPTVTRLTTLAGGLFGAALSFYTFIALLKIETLGLKLLSVAFAVYLFFGPLPGFFAFATRPDTWALVLDIIAVFVFIKFYSRTPVAAILLYCVFAYLAWSFKQAYVFSQGTIGLYLLLRWDWKALLLLVGGVWGSWILTLLIGGQLYVNSIFLGSTVYTLALENTVRTFGNFAIKFLPGILGLVAIAALPSVRSMTIDAIKRHDVTKIAFLGVLVAGVISLTASMKEGASESYFFPLSYYSSLLILSVLAWAEKTRKVTLTRNLWLLGLGWVLSFIAIMMVLSGLKGTLSVRPLHKTNTLMKKCMQNLTKPIYTNNPYLSLPWMLPAKEHFVVQLDGNAHPYLSNRAAGMEMEAGGIGGLIDQGYFSTLVLSVVKDGYFDGSDLTRYRLEPKKCGSYEVYSRK